jgi:hypothetical protein
MKIRLLLPLAGLLLLFGGAASAQISSVDIFVDEDGHGLIFGFVGRQTLPSALLPDPGPGGLPAALTYGLINPPGLVAGDVILRDRIDGPNSDIIRFNPNQNGGSLVFYSDPSDPADDHPDLADTGFPTALYTNVVTLVEVGPEGNNGVDYTPTAGQPGFVAGAAVPVTYHITSDVPEPGTYALLAGLGVSSLFAVRRLRRRRK